MPGWSRLERGHLLLRSAELVVLVQQFGLVVLTGKLEHGDSVHAVSHLDESNLSE